MHCNILSVEDAVLSEEARAAPSRFPHGQSPPSATRPTIFSPLFLSALFPLSERPTVPRPLAFPSLLYPSVPLSMSSRSPLDAARVKFEPTPFYPTPTAAHSQPLNRPHHQRSLAVTHPTRFLSPRTRRA